MTDPTPALAARDDPATHEYEQARKAVVLDAVLAYDMRDSAHDADFLSYLWASVERYKAAILPHLRGKAPPDFVPGKGWRHSDGSFGIRPESN